MAEKSDSGVADYVPDHGLNHRPKLSEPNGGNTNRPQELPCGVRGCLFHDPGGKNRDKAFN